MKTIERNGGRKKSKTGEKREKKKKRKGRYLAKNCSLFFLSVILSLQWPASSPTYVLGSLRREV